MGMSNFYRRPNKSMSFTHSNNHKKMAVSTKIEGKCIILFLIGYTPIYRKYKKKPIRNSNVVN